MGFTPSEGQLLIRRVRSAKLTADGMTNPVIAGETPLEGEVVAVGPGVEFRPPEVRIGDRVFFREGVGTAIAIDGETSAVLVMNEADLLCAVRKTAARNAA
jgi:chaperonin GroES